MDTRQRGLLPKPSQNQSHAPVPNRRVPAGAPEWVTPDLIERTINVFQPKYNEPLTPELSLEIILNTVHLFDLLTEE
jgi:hypothetical protein